MTSAAVLSWPVGLNEDRALGTEAKVLREVLEEAAAPAREHRSDEIASLLVKAVQRAEDRDGTTVSARVFAKTWTFMESLPTELPLPVAVVESEEEIGLDWDEAPERVVSFTIDHSDNVGFAALFGRDPLYGTVECTSGFSEGLRYVLARLYPSVLPV